MFEHPFTTILEKKKRDPDYITLHMSSTVISFRIRAFIPVSFQKKTSQILLNQKVLHDEMSSGDITTGTPPLSEFLPKTMGGTFRACFSQN